MAAVVGPTATGKTELGIGLCQRLGGEVVSCDSMQVYRGLPIGTAQPTPEELAAAPHHLIGFLDVNQPFSVSDYVEAAGKAIQGIRARGKFPVLVGGTGLYARSLLRGFSFEENGRDEVLRQKLFRQAEEQGAEALYRRLQELDPKAAEEIHPHNVKRVVRALEYIQLCSEPFSQQAERSRTAQSPYQYVMLCLTYRDREALYRRIDQRVDRMLEQGLLEEARLFFNRCQGSERIPPPPRPSATRNCSPTSGGRPPLRRRWRASSGRAAGTPSGRSPGLSGRNGWSSSMWTVFPTARRCWMKAWPSWRSGAL